MFKKNYVTIAFSHTIRTWLPVFAAGMLVFILANCARESRPTGGAKDTLAPAVILEKPNNNSINVRPQKITIKFDEAIQLDKIQENCMISPALDEFPEITAKNKKLIISLQNNTLQAQTTYNFSFTNAIKDINEGNTIESYSYAFSTSEVIDSFKIAGKVSYAHNLQPPKAAYVVLHSNEHDSVFSTKKPKYITQTTKNGSFEFNHIAPGEYKLFALEDANKDYMFNQAHELIAFHDSIIRPWARQTTDTVWYKRKNDSIPQSIDSFVVQPKTIWSHQDIELQLFKNSAAKLNISNAQRISLFAYGWKFSKPVTSSDFSVHIPNFSSSSYTTEILSDSIILWLYDTLLMKQAETPILVSHSSTTDTLKLFASKDVPSRLLCNVSKNKSTITPVDSITITMLRPIQTETKPMYLARVKDSLTFTTMWHTPHAIDAEKLPIITSQAPPLQTPYVPKYFYQKQELLSHKIGQHRCAFYFAKPIQLSDIQLQLETLPQLTNWYLLEYDVSTNAVLCWITNPDIMKLKNTSIIIRYPSEGSTISKTIEFAPGFSKKDSFKKVVHSKLVVDVLETQKKELLLDNAIHIVCNNPIQTVTKELFTLIDAADSLQLSCISNIEKYGTRGILVYYNGKPSATYTLRIQKDALTDIYGTTNKAKEIKLQTQKQTTCKIYTQLQTTVYKQGLRNYTIAPPAVAGSYALIIPSNSYVDIYGAANDSCIHFFQISKSETYGSLRIAVKPYNSNILIQLYKKDSKSNTPDYQQNVSNQGVYSFAYVQPGEYLMRAIIDKNKNLLWDSGSLDTRQQPETIIQFEKPITIKANWDNSIEWKMEN